MLVSVLFVVVVVGIAIADVLAVDIAVTNMRVGGVFDVLWAWLLVWLLRLLLALPLVLFYCCW